MLPEALDERIRLDEPMTVPPDAVTFPLAATLVGVIAPSDNVIAGVVVLVATVPLIPFALTTDTSVTVPLPLPAGAAHVPSARKYVVVPPPLAGANPFSVLLNVFNSAVACVAVKSSGAPVPAVVRPLNVAVDTLANLALVTTPLSMVQVVPDPETVMSPLSPSEILPPPVAATVIVFAVLSVVSVTLLPATSVKACDVEAGVTVV